MPQQAIREAIDNVARAIAANPEKGLVKNSPATASLTNDLTFSITGPKGEKAQTDMPTALGALAGRPSPVGSGTAGLTGVRRLAAANSSLSNVVFPGGRMGPTTQRLPRQAERVLDHSYF